ncbi:unnamed protein product [Acanthoscelides obtectus]|uniref:Uncharacterized protein n=1 Tax=Acanthoscelides obtectus TaxID=200917 RepID=A0A9P0LDQ8_ACAOB|nr:unnamed protein product [Acanthoscelides obtectus]CAK1662245.1 hypothetical protein AOBTE_LOCUS23053 [Acanthoscelides obtectus]
MGITSSVNAKYIATANGRCKFLEMYICIQIIAITRCTRGYMWGVGIAGLVISYLLLTTAVAATAFEPRHEWGMLLILCILCLLGGVWSLAKSGNEIKETVSGALSLLAGVVYFADSFIRIKQYCAELAHQRSMGYSPQWYI